MSRPSALLLVFALSVSVFADQLSLKNGDRLSGTIAKSDGKIIVLHTDYAGDIEIKLNSIESIQSAEPLYLEFQSGRTAVGRLSGAEAQIRVESKTGESVQAPVSDIKSLRNQSEQTAYEKSLRPGLLQGWNTGLNVGFALTRGNSETKNLALAFTGVRQTLHDKLGAYVNSVYATNDAAGAVPSTTANSAGGGFRYDHDIRPRVFGFVAADFFSDSLQGLNIRSVLGGGAGYHLIKNDSTTLDLLAGVNYTHESYTALTRNFAALTLGEDLTHKIGKSTVLNQDFSFFPDLNHTGEYRTTFDFGTVTKLNKWFGWQNGFSDIYVSNPPLGKRKNDLIFTTGLNIALTR